LLECLPGDLAPVHSLHVLHPLLQLLWNGYRHVCLHRCTQVSIGCERYKCSRPVQDTQLGLRAGSPVMAASKSRTRAPYPSRQQALQPSLTPETDALRWRLLTGLAYNLSRNERSILATPRATANI